MRTSTITVLLPETLKRWLESRARTEHRSLSAQNEAELQRVALEGDAGAAAPGSFLGRFAESRLPTDDDLMEVRRLLWGQLGRDS